MNEKIIYIGLDVDDQSFHGAALIAPTGHLNFTKQWPVPRRIPLDFAGFKNAG